MSILYRRNVRRIVTGTLFTVLLFVFVHSEFDQFSAQDNDHHLHDYCQLVDGAIMRINKNVSEETLSDSPQKVESNQLSGCALATVKTTAFFLLNERPNFRGGDRLHIHNRIFLI